LEAIIPDACDRYGHKDALNLVIGPYFFSCQTGYSLTANSNGTELGFDLISENPTLKEKVWWFLFKPFHGLFANKVLSVIKEKVEHNQ